jgi:hypothetical protein
LSPVGEKTLAGDYFTMDPDAILTLPQAIDADIAKALEHLTITSTNSGTYLIVK